MDEAAALLPALDVTLPSEMDLEQHRLFTEGNNLKPVGRAGRHMPACTSVLARAGRVGADVEGRGWASAVQPRLPPARTGRGILALLTACMHACMHWLAAGEHPWR